MALVNNGINRPERHNIELVAVRWNHKPLYLYQCFWSCNTYIGML